MLKEYIVSLNKGIDYDAFWNEIENDGSGSTYIPYRPVDILNVRPLTQRACHYALSDEEAEKLRNDDRVSSVEIPPSQRDDIIKKPFVTQTGVYSKLTGTPNKIWVNWGLPRTNARINNTPDTSGSFTYEYNIDGTGVDYIVQDSGLQCDHPDFQNANGVSRVQKINWWTAAGESGPPPWNPNGEAGMPAGFYTDTIGHGTHVCGISVGKTYGRAKNSNIYVMKIDGLGGVGGIDDIVSFEVITAWHNNKPIDPVTGFRRPTVVNMSWGYSAPFANISGGNYRGTAWVGNIKQPQYGMTGSYYGVRIDSVDTVVQDCLDAGVVLVGAAGNEYMTMAALGGADYNNYFNSTTLGRRYYMRGGTPTVQSNVICVGSIDITYATGNKEQKAAYSNSGPRVDVFAPGTFIVSTVSNVYEAAFAQAPYGVNVYPPNPNFKIANIQGTSMASPNVAGIVAQLLQVYPGETPAQIRQRVIDLSTKDVLYTTGLPTDYATLNALHGAPNRYAYYEYNAPVPPEPDPDPGNVSFVANGAIEMLNTTINT